MKITINLNKAKEIKKEHIREERKAELAKLDVDFMRAVEQGNTQLQQEIAAKKQALRDAPSEIDSIETIEQLKQVKLEDLI
jgi:hypothetical protein